MAGTALFAGPIGGVQQSARVDTHMERAADDNCSKTFRPDAGGTTVH